MPKTSSVGKQDEKVEFENDRVRVIRVHNGSRQKTGTRTRGDRVLIWLTDSHHTRKEPNGKTEEVHRRAGDVAWRAASKHDVEHHNAADAELIIVELKSARGV